MTPCGDGDRNRHIDTSAVEVQNLKPINETRQISTSDDISPHDHYGCARKRTDSNTDMSVMVIQIQILIFVIENLLLQIGGDSYSSYNSTEEPLVLECECTKFYDFYSSTIKYTDKTLTFGNEWLL